MAARIIFITGTDTEAGKTVLTALSLCHFQARGKRVRALKPFCSGGWEDADLLRSLHQPVLSREQISPWFFSEPLAPLIAARHEHREVERRQVLQTVQNASANLDILLVEGAGGLLTPLGTGFNAVNLIQDLGAEVLVAGRNRLGIINHALLAIACLKSQQLHAWKFALMGANLDSSSSTNKEALQECLKGDSARLHHFPEFGHFDETNARSNSALCRAVLDALLG